MFDVDVTVVIFAVMITFPLLALSIMGKIGDKYSAWDEADKASRRRKLEILRNRR